MMGRVESHQRRLVYDFCLENQVPGDHLLRRIDAYLDLDAFRGRLGAIDHASWFKPQANAYSSRTLPSTPLDPDVKAFDKMPG